MSRFLVINRNNDFVRAYKRGKSQVHPILVTYLLKCRQGQPRVGITATKKVGCAVKRNRAKRLIRAAYMDLGCPLPNGWYVVFVARGRTPASKMQQVRDVMQRQLKALLPARQSETP